jgi:cytochrome c
VLGVPLASAAVQTTNSFSVVLVFSKTMGSRHDSIPEGIAAIRALGSEHGFTVDDTEDAGRFTDATLARYKAIVFINDRRRPRSGSEGRV